MTRRLLFQHRMKIAALHEHLPNKTMRKMVLKHHSIPNAVLCVDVWETKGDGPIGHSGRVIYVGSGLHSREDEVGVERCSELVFHYPPLTRSFLGHFFYGLRLFCKATLEQCQQKHLALFHYILGSSSARIWKLHVGLISRRRG